MNEALTLPTFLLDEWTTTLPTLKTPAPLLTDHQRRGDRLPIARATTE
jgi:hypothetical protein